LRVNKFDHITDQELLQNYYETDDAAWIGILLERYTMLLFGVCMKYLKNEEDSKDGVQQVFLKAVTELKKYKVEYVKSWLYMVAKNHCLMKLRDKSDRYKTELNENIEAPDDTSLISDIKNKDLVLQHIESSMQELPIDQKTCVTLFYLNKRSYREIAEATGFTEMQVKSYIQNGKRNLKIAVERKLKHNNE
jgi:RNA polymerase sigma factor (sigma-70 family)